MMVSSFSYRNTSSCPLTFGWSVSDIAQAITLIVQVVKALDDANGAAAGYHEANSFLQSLRHTLEPLHTFTALDTYQAYKEEIRKCVDRIHEPIENFLVVATKFERSLGMGAKTSPFRQISGKLQWTFIESKAVDN